MGIALSVAYLEEERVLFHCVSYLDETDSSKGCCPES